MIAFLGAHRTDEREVIHLRRESRKVLADPNPGHRRLNCPEGAAVRMARLHVEGVCLARPAVHPEMIDGAPDVLPNTWQTS